MALKFVLLVNKQGQTRLAKYSDQSMTVEERRVLEGEIVRKCLARAERQVSVLCWAELLHLVMKNSVKIFISPVGTEPQACCTVFLC